MSSSVTTGGTGVEAAPVTPEVVRAHGLTDAEYAEIRRLLGRAPNLTELGVFSVMWSEHCSYKSSRKHLKQLPTEGARVIHGPGENAGVMDIGDGLAVVFRSRATTILPSSNRTRARPPAWAASCGTSSPWARAPSRA